MEERPGGGNASAGTRTDVLLDSRYRLGQVLARGGMSTVHRAIDTRLERPVAVKIMDPRLAADPAFRTRFEREARSAARINHPAVVDVHDQGTGEVGGEPVVFLVMELVEGGTLREVLAARGRLDLPSAVAVLRSVLAGLAEAHRRGLVHRDVKPENVLISRTGDVKVADFGLVTAVAQAGASHAGMIMGTVAYLSPEQVTSGSADARSDVYAAGVMLVELLTGAPPFSGDTPLSVAYRHVHDDVPPPSRSGIDVPAPVDDLVVRATRRDPAERPADAATFLAALDQAAARAGVPSVPPPLPPPRVDDAGGPSAVGPGPGGTRALSWPALPAPARPSPVSRKPLSGPETSRSGLTDDGGPGSSRLPSPLSSSWWCSPAARRGGPAPIGGPRCRPSSVWSARPRSDSSWVRTSSPPSSSPTTTRSMPASSRRWIPPRPRSSPAAAACGWSCPSARPWSRTSPPAPPSLRRSARSGRPGSSPDALGATTSTARPSPPGR